MHSSLLPLRSAKKTIIWVAAVVLFATCASAYAGTVECPLGTWFKSKISQKHSMRVEWCEDKNGQREGPARFVRETDGRVEAEFPYRSGKTHGVGRIYDEDGALGMEVFFENGEETGSRLSVDALRRLFDEKNAEARERGRKWQIVGVDERSVQYESVVRFPWSWFMPGEATVHKRLSSQPGFCAIFSLQGTQFESVRVRYIKESGALIVATTVTKADCVESERGD